MNTVQKSSHLHSSNTKTSLLFQRSACRLLFQNSVHHLRLLNGGTAIRSLYLYRRHKTIPAISYIVTEDLAPNLPFQLSRYKKARIIAKSDYMWWQFYRRWVHMHCGQAGFVVLRVPNIMYKYSWILISWKSQVSSIREILDFHCRAAEHQILWYATLCQLMKLPTFLNFEKFVTLPVQTV